MRYRKEYLENLRQPFYKNKEFIKMTKRIFANATNVRSLSDVRPLNDIQPLVEEKLIFKFNSTPNYTIPRRVMPVRYNR